MPNSTRTIQVKINGDAGGLARSAAVAYAALRKVGQDTSGLRAAQKDAAALATQLDQTAKEAKDKGSLMGGALALGVSAAAPLVSAALVGGVSLGLVGAVALVQKDNAKVGSAFADLAHQVLTEMTSVTNQAVPALVKSGKSMQQTFANLGPQLRTAFKAAGPDITILTSGVERLATNAMPGLVAAARNSQPVMRGFSTVLGDIGSTISTVFTDVSQHSDVLERDLDKVGTLIQNVGGVVGAVLPGLASGFGTTVGAVNGLLGVLKPVAPVLGDITGEALPAIGAFKLFGLATGPLNSLGSKVTSAGAKLGIFSAQLTNSASVGEKVTKTTSKLGSALGTMGKALPIAGVGFALLGDAMSAAESQQQAVLQGLLAGGQAAKDATTKIGDAAPAIAHLASGFQQGEGTAQQFSDALDVATKGMNPLQKATATYNADVARFGPSSLQAADAQVKLAAATDANQVAQQKLANATQDANIQLLHQTDTLLNAINDDLAYQSSILTAAQAQKTYAQSLKSSGANSLATKQASIAYQQSLISEINAAEAAAVAHHTNASASQQAKIQQQAETGTILGLAAAAGKNAPPALKSMVAGLTDTQVAAFAATGKIKGTHQEVVTLPDGKKIKINVNSNGQAVVNQTLNQLSRLPRSRTVQLTVNENIVLGNTKGANVGGRGVAGLLGLPGRATGGPVLAGRAYIVGEHRPELFIPDRDGHVAPSVPDAGIGGWTGDIVLPIDLGSGVQQVIRISNRDLVRAVKARSKIR